MKKGLTRDMVLARDKNNKSDQGLGEVMIIRFRQERKSSSLWTILLMISKYRIKPTDNHNDLQY